MPASALERDRAVRVLVATGSGIDTDHVIPGHGIGPRIYETYASVLLIRDTKRAQSARWTQLDEDTGEVLLHHRTYRRATYSVQWYRPGADQLCDNFLDWVESDLCQYTELELDITVADAEDNYEKGEIDDATDDKWEERRNVNLVIDYARLYTQRTGRLQSVNTSISSTAG